MEQMKRMEREGKKGRNEKEKEEWNTNKEEKIEEKIE